MTKFVKLIFHEIKRGRRKTIIRYICISEFRHRVIIELYITRLVDIHIGVCIKKPDSNYRIQLEQKQFSFSQFWWFGPAARLIILCSSSSSSSRTTSAGFTSTIGWFCCNSNRFLCSWTNWSTFIFGCFWSRNIISPPFRRFLLVIVFGCRGGQTNFCHFVSYVYNSFGHIIFILKQFFGATFPQGSVRIKSKC